MRLDLHVRARRAAGRNDEAGLLTGLLSLAFTVAAAGADLPPLRLVTVADGFRQPVHAVMGPDRVFHVVEQEGVIRRLSPGRRKHEPFLDIRERVTSGGEMGLLGLAFHPRYAANRRLFVNYTTRANGSLETRVSEFTASPEGRAADPGSERILLTFPQPYSNHNGGLVEFGPDGMLYIGVGDGGAANDPHDAGQRLDTWLGKILRIDVDTRAEEAAYGVPLDNPFVGRAGAKPEIWAYGLRNPWRFSFDRETRELWCGDVGQNAREEISLIERGGNYGWRIMEGFICTPRVNPDCDPAGLLPPVVDYPRSEGVSVTGGYVYRGRRWSALYGVYLYGDFATGHIWGLRRAQGRLTGPAKLIENGPRVASFAQDLDGELYVVDYDGRIARIEPARR